jgi:serine/threonine-protein kinase
MYGAYALLKPFAEKGDWSAYLIAIDGADVPWIIKRRRPKSGDGFDLKTAKSDTKLLARMSSPYLASVLTCTETDGEAGIVIEHVPGKSLDTICHMANERGLLLPPKLGVVLAHDIFSAIAYFYEFENASRVHGNVSPRTIILGYSGEAKLAGYRPGFHERAEAAVQVAKDLKPFAEILCELPFRSFPTELAHVVPRLLENAISPAESLTVAMEFVRGYEPSASDREEVSAWLDEVFPGEDGHETGEHEKLVKDGLKLIASARGEKAGLAKNPVVGDEIGEYRLVDLLGEGGMGRVYEAEHVKTGKRVALKLLHPRSRTSTIDERFRREAEAILRIANAHVVDIEQFGTTADGKYLYLAMERLQGESLDHVLSEQAPLEPLRALKIASQICHALSATHAVDIIHRDLKPANVMLVERDSEADFVKLLDFGLARLDVGESALTKVGDLIGTFAYMAPEQGLGELATPKIDIYAVGEILYEMLTKRRPHEGADNILGRKANVDPVPIAKYCPDLSDDIVRLVMKSLSRDPGNRHATMAHLGQAIDDIIAQLELPTRRRKLQLAVGALCALVVLAGAVSLVRGRTRQPATERTRTSIPAPPPPAPIPTVPAKAVPKLSAEPSKAVAQETASLPPLATKPQPKAKATDGHAPKNKPENASAERLLDAAKTAYDSGNHLEAVKLGLQALSEGGGLRAHLALGNYYRGMERYREALQHYRAVLELDPRNPVAIAGAKLVERQLSSSP